MIKRTIITHCLDCGKDKVQTELFQTCCGATVQAIIYRDTKLFPRPGRNETKYDYEGK